MGRWSISRAACLTFASAIFLPTTVQSENIKQVNDAKYLDVIASRSGEVSLRSQFFVCFRVNGQMIVGVMRSWTWSYGAKFRYVERGRVMKVRYSDTDIWAAWPDGKEMKLKQDYSNTEFVERCKRLVENSNSSLPLRKVGQAARPPVLPCPLLKN